MTNQQKNWLRAMASCAKNAQKIARILDHCPERKGETNSLYSYILLWLPRDLVRYFPLMSDDDLCLLCKARISGLEIEIIRRAAKDKADQVDGVDGYAAFELVHIQSSELSNNPRYCDLIPTNPTLLSVEWPSPVVTRTADGTSSEGGVEVEYVQKII